MPAVVDMLLLVTQTVPEADPTRPSQLLRTQILLLYVFPCLTVMEHLPCTIAGAGDTPGDSTHISVSRNGLPSRGPSDEMNNRNYAKHH